MAEQRVQTANGAPSYTDLRQRVLGFALVFTIFVVVATAFGFIQLRTNALNAAKERAQSYSHVLGAHLERTINAMDSRLAQIALQSARLGGPTGPDADWAPVLAAARSGGATVGSLSITDSRGVVRHSTLPELIGKTRQDGFIYASLSNPDAPELLTDAPMHSPFTGHIVVPFGRKLVSRDGRIVGAVVAGFAPESLRTFYRSVDTEGGAVRIIHSSGMIVLQEPEARTERVSNDDPVMGALADRQNDAVVGPLSAGGRSMISAFTAVQSTGLVVSVSLDKSRALSVWRGDALVSGAVILGVLVAFWAAVLLTLRQLEAREVAEGALLEQQLRSAEAQRLESLGQLTGGVAHDFNNLLTVIITAADSLTTRVAAELKPRVEAILYAADNGAELVRQLLAFSRRQALEFSPVDVNGVAAAMEDMVRRTLGARVETRFKLAPALWLAYADRAQIESALLNLTINARDAMPDGGVLTVETQNFEVDGELAQSEEMNEGDYVVISVTDSGVGMPQDTLKRAVEPFFTTKDVGKGSGLGLSMIYGFAKQSKGHLKIYSEPGHGTTVRLFLPRDMSGADAARPLVSGKSDRGSERILLVEDDARVRELAVSGLRDRGYDVVEAANGAEAVVVLDSDRKLDLLLTDIVMPGAMTGRDVAEHAVKARPGIKVLFTSGFADASVLRAGLDTEARFLPKPYRSGQLAATVRALLDDEGALTQRTA